MTHSKFFLSSLFLSDTLNSIRFHIAFPNQSDQQFKISEGFFIVVIFLRFAQKYHNNKFFPIDSNKKSIFRFTTIRYDLFWVLV